MGDDAAERRVVTLLGLGVQPATGAAVMVLREPGEAGRALARSPSWLPRPLTHQLLLNVVAGMGRRLREVTICGLRDGVFLAELVLDDGTRVGARPSDAVPVALTAGVPICVAPDVLERAAGPVEQLTEGADTDRDGRPAGPSGGSTQETPPDEIDHQAQQLAAWLESATANDFTTEPGGPDHPDQPGG